MKKTMLAVLLFLLMALTFMNVPKVSVATTGDLWVTYGLLEDVPSEPPSDPPEYYLNTTNPDADGENPAQSENPAYSEVDLEEGNKPLYVLVFADEEERATLRKFPWDQPTIYRGYGEWAPYQIERGDESLVAQFGIDIRILDWLWWDSDNSKTSMYDLWDELEEDTQQYLHQWYDGTYWSHYVDAIIGITAQATPDDPKPVAGLAPYASKLNEWKTFIILKWQAYWADDNLVQHEVSHLFYAPNHDYPGGCCVLSGHDHIINWWIWEDRYWWVWTASCSYLTYSWCTYCKPIISNHKDRYVERQLTISTDTGGTTDPPPGIHLYRKGIEVTVWADSDVNYRHEYWLLDGNTHNENPIIFIMEHDRTLHAYFYNCGPGGPSPGDPALPDEIEPNL